MDININTWLCHIYTFLYKCDVDIQIHLHTHTYSTIFSACTFRDITEYKITQITVYKKSLYCHIFFNI